MPRNLNKTCSAEVAAGVRWGGLCAGVGESFLGTAAADAVGAAGAPGSGAPSGSPRIEGRILSTERWRNEEGIDSRGRPWKRVDEHLKACVQGTENTWKVSSCTEGSRSEGG